MASTQANGITIEYEILGDPGAPPLLLIMGLGAQLIDWPPGFCELLTGRGYRVIRFDNRDAGLSQGFDAAGVPDFPAVLAGDVSSVPYRVADMAADAAGLLDALGVGAAHVAGLSLGGMIAQQLTIDFPERVLSLCSIMSTTGDRTVGRSTPEAAAMLRRPAATNRADAIANGVAAARLIGSPAFPADADDLLRRVTAKIDRAYRPAGTARQSAAVLTAPDRTPRLREVRVPAVVVHGEEDPLIDVSGGRATAAAIPGAELVVVPGMGHDLPAAVWPQIAAAIDRTARRQAAAT
jgi:pimeloyl-ACP methyl ester carboxylesterase